VLCAQDRSAHAMPGDVDGAKTRGDRVAVREQLDYDWSATSPTSTAMHSNPPRRRRWSHESSRTAHTGIREGKAAPMATDEDIYSRIKSLVDEEHSLTGEEYRAALG
jgi:hypothetical protein